jgi:single-strand DNA-binding protein
MANLNKVMIIGNLTQDPDCRHTPSGKQIVTLRLATNRDTTDQQGNKQKETTFLDVTCYGKIGELAAQYLAKGRPVFIEGRLHMQQWQDKQTGQQRTKLIIVAENLQFLGGGTPTQQRQQGGNNYNRGAYPNDNPTNYPTRNQQRPQQQKHDERYHDVPQPGNEYDDDIMF